MLRDVKHHILDGQLGLSSEKGEGIHLKIGASPMEGLMTISGNATVSKIREALGYSPLADAAMDSVENGAAKILCLPVAASVAGEIVRIDSEIAGAGACGLSGKPHNSFQVVIKITGSGGLNEAAFAYSLNGGISYSDEFTIPLEGKYVIEEAGLELEFTISGEGMYQMDDIFLFETTAPKMSNQDILTAIEKLKDISQEFEYVHIVDSTAPETWAAISAQQVTLQETCHKPLFFVLEAPAPEAGQDLADYITMLKVGRKLVKNEAIQVVAARLDYTRMDGSTKDINAAGIVGGLYARAKVSQSIGQTDTFYIGTDKANQLLPEGIEDYLEELDEAGYLTMRQYHGLDGFYITNARVFCPDNSDFRYAEDVRVRNKIIRKTRKEALLQLHQDVDLTDIDGDLAAKALFIQAPLENMLVDKEISAVSVEAPSGQDILETETMELIIRYIPRGKIREIVITLGVAKSL